MANERDWPLSAKFEYIRLDQIIYKPMPDKVEQIDSWLSGSMWKSWDFVLKVIPILKLPIYTF